MWRLRRRLRELEARVDALETPPSVSYDMPPRPKVRSQPVDVDGLWRERVNDYATPAPDIEDGWGVYL